MEEWGERRRGVRKGQVVMETGPGARRGRGLMTDGEGETRRGSAHAANRYPKRCRRARGSSLRQPLHQPALRGRRERAGAATGTSQRRQHCSAAAHGQTRGCVPSAAPPRRRGRPCGARQPPPACILTDSTSHTSERRPRRAQPRGGLPLRTGDHPGRPRHDSRGRPATCTLPRPPETAAPRRQTRQRISCRRPLGPLQRGDGRLSQPSGSPSGGGHTKVRPGGGQTSASWRRRREHAHHRPDAPRAKAPPSGRVLPPPTAASAAKCDVLARGAGVLALARPVHGPVLCHVERRHSPWPGMIGAATWTAHRRLGHAWGPPGHVVVPAKGVCPDVATPSAQKGRRIRFSAHLPVVCGGHAARWTAAYQKYVGGWPTPAGGYILLVLPGHVVEHLPSAPPRPRPGRCEWLGLLGCDGRLPRPPRASRERAGRTFLAARGRDRRWVLRTGRPAR